MSCKVVDDFPRVRECGEKRIFQNTHMTTVAEHIALFQVFNNDVCCCLSLYVFSQLVDKMYGDMIDPDNMIDEVI